MKIIENMTEREKFLVESLVHIENFHHLDDDIGKFAERVLYLASELPVETEIINKKAIIDKVYDAYLNNQVVSRELVDFIEQELEG